MKTRAKNPLAKGMMEKLSDKGIEQPIWRAVAKGLNRPRRKRYEVNISDLEKNANAKDTIVVPGVVLSSGELSKALNVAALRFSPSAKAKIEKAGGKCMSIEEITDSKIKGIRIMG